MKRNSSFLFNALMGIAVGNFFASAVREDDIYYVILGIIAISIFVSHEILKYQEDNEDDEYDEDNEDGEDDEDDE